MREESLGPICSPDRMDLCDEEKKEKLDEFMAMPMSPLDLNWIPFGPASFCCKISGFPLPFGFPFGFPLASFFLFLFFFWGGFAFNTTPKTGSLHSSLAVSFSILLFWV